MQIERFFRLLGLCFLVATASAATINSVTITGTQITIMGTGFVGTPLVVTFDGTSIPIISSSSTQIVATLNPLPIPGTYRVVVKAGVVSTLAYVTAPAVPGIVAEVSVTESGLVTRNAPT